MEMDDFIQFCEATCLSIFLYTAKTASLLVSDMCVGVFAFWTILNITMLMHSHA